MGILSFFENLFGKKKKRKSKGRANASSKNKTGKGKAGFKRDGAPKPVAKPMKAASAEKVVPKAPAKSASTPSLKANTAKYATQGNHLNDCFKDFDSAKAKTLIQDLVKVGRAIDGNAQEKAKQVNDTIGQLEGAIGQKEYSITSRLASSLINDANILTDPALDVAREQLALVTKIERNLQNKDRLSFKQDIAELIQATANLDELISVKIEQNNGLSTKLVKALTDKDYHAVAGASDRIAKDTAILSVVFSGKRIEISNETGISVLASGGDRLSNLKKKATELKKATMERNFLGAMELARNISQNAALIAHPNLAKANALLEQGDNLRKALKDRNKDAALLLAGNIVKSSGVFKGQALDRSKQISDHLLKLQAALSDRNYHDLLAAATSIWRETAILSDMVFFRSSALSQQIGRIETAIKGDDIGRALLSIEKIIL